MGKRHKLKWGPLMWKKLYMAESKERIVSLIDSIPCSACRNHSIQLWKELQDLPYEIPVLIWLLESIVCCKLKKPMNVFIEAIPHT